MNSPESTTYRGKKLIDAGTSGIGGSFHEVWKCPQRGAYQYILGLGNDGPPAEPLIKGSLVHVGLSHFYARLQARQQGWTGERCPDAYFSPTDAVEALAERQEENRVAWARWVPFCQTAVADYCAVAALDEEREVLAIEERHEIVLPAVREMLGEPWGTYACRYDLVTRDRAGRVQWWDHKTTYRVDKRKKEAFTLSLGILGLTRVANEVYPGHAGGILNLISLGKKEPPTRVTPEIAPWAIAQFDQVILDRQHTIKSLRESGRDPWEYPKILSEQGPCTDRYGACPHRDRCRFGPT